MRTTSKRRPQPTTAALRIGAAAALAFTAMLGVSALVGPAQQQSSGAERLDPAPSHSATASPGVLVAGETSR
jgi:hypothetical protein